MGWIVLALPGALIWSTLLLLPWRPWRVREVLEANDIPANVELADVTVLIPARNEAETIASALGALNSQGHALKTVLVDDQSTDATVELARAAATHELLVIAGQPLPVGWTGKLWALQQGRAYLERPLTLLMDADIELAPGTIAALRRTMEQKQIRFISLMAALRMQTFWEKLLLPAFIFFFRLLYPFNLSNDPTNRRVAAAAGGCILLETKLVDEIGGFAALRGALIDDCTLARRVKDSGASTWVGLTHSVRSVRRYDRLEAIWNMVARSAFTQLHYSTAALLGCTAVFIAAFWLPLATLLLADWPAQAVAGLAALAMIISYLPTLRFYRLGSGWALTLPLIGTLYLAMTWSSALRYWRGQRSRWKDRVYSKILDSGSSG
jgi:hopene-associated glycosyltransferase HpnB